MSTCSLPRCTDSSWTLKVFVCNNCRAMRTLSRTMNNYLCGLQLARDGGATVILDCGGADAAISQELLPLLSVLSPNETELARLTGARGNRRSDCLDISNSKSPARAHLINWHHASIGSHW